MVLNNAINSVNPVIQIVSTSLGTLLDCSTTMPYDNTIPQKTEGTQVFTLAITPKSATSILVITFSGSISADATAVDVSVALFQDSTSDALAAKGIAVAATNSTTATLQHIMTSGTTSSTTFAIRAGGNASHVYVNGNSAGAQLMGGVSSTTLTIVEYLA